MFYLDYKMKMVSGILLKIIQLISILSFLHIYVNCQGDFPKCKEKRSKLVGETCFQFNGSPVTWYQAKTNCESNGMLLAYVSSVNQIREILENQSKYERVWIGASDANKEGQFVWVASGENAAELSHLWSSGEPNNIKRNADDEDCVNIFPTFLANDDLCSFNMSYLCMEKSCPYNINVEGVFDDKVTLSWKPGFNGGPPQTFTVKYQDLRTNVSQVAGSVTVPRINQTASRAVEYSISGLSTKTLYKVYIHASINKGKSECPPLTITTKTTGPPACPVNITVHDIVHDRVSLSWTPGQEDELPQIYTILAYNVSVFKTIPIDMVLVATVYTNNYSRIVHTVEHLSETTHYSFSIDVENKFGKRKCNDDYVQVTTTSGLQTCWFPIWLIVVVVCAPLVLAACIVGFVCCWRKANRTFKVEKPNTYDSLTKDKTHNNKGNDMALLYTAPSDLAAFPMDALVAQDKTNLQGIQPMKFDPIYSSTSDMIQIVNMKFAGSDDHHIYNNTN